MSRNFPRTPRITSLPLAAAAIFATAARIAPDRLAAQAAPPLARETVIADVERVLAEGTPFRATQLLGPLLATPAGREPGIVLLAARAAAGWEGWGSVVRLLAGQPWLDELAAGEGRGLLARARVERGEPAITEARRAVAAETPHPGALGPRLVTLARALDRADQLDSAAAVYLRAERLLPAAGDWLRLRAAGVLADSAARSRLYREVSSPAAAGRVRWTEALARDRSGDWRGAARLYDELGARVAGIRIRLRAAATPVARNVLRGELIAVLAGRPSPEEARESIALLDGAFPSLTAEEELIIARRAASSDPARAARGFRRASSAKSLQDADKLSYGGVLTRLGRHDEGRGLLAQVRTRELRAQSEYLRARSLLSSGAAAGARAALRQLSTEFWGDSATAANAGYLAADLLVDQGDDSGAREEFLQVARRFPRTSHGARAALLAGVLAWVHGERTAAAREFASLSERAAETSEGVAALYWHGRSLHATGDTLAAFARWRTILDRFPTSYYTVPAAERLGVPAVHEAPGAVRSDPDSAVVAALDRAELLERLGLRVEARFEHERLVRYAEASPAATLAIARAFAERGEISRAFRVALRAGEGGAPELVFPLPGPTVIEEARRAGVDPHLAAALIRQESAFDPQARSRADARGLMQVLPSVGAGLAPAAGLGEWDASLLYQPEINVHFGMAHLAQALRRYPRLVEVLASYNAGGRPTGRWSVLPGAGQDAEVFIERIQYLETRDYVRRVIRNLAVYRALYPSLP